MPNFSRKIWILKTWYSRGQPRMSYVTAKEKLQLPIISIKKNVKGKSGKILKILNALNVLINAVTNIVLPCMWKQFTIKLKILIVTFVHSRQVVDVLLLSMLMLSIWTSYTSAICVNMKPLKEQAFMLTRKQSMIKSRITNVKSVSICVVDQNILRPIFKHIMKTWKRIGNAAFATMQPLASTDLGDMFEIVILQRSIHA